VPPSKRIVPPALAPLEVTSKALRVEMVGTVRGSSFGSFLLQENAKRNNRAVSTQDPSFFK
jgi:hypothetical protein